MANYEIRILRLELSEATRAEAETAFQSGRMVLATWDVKCHFSSARAPEDNISRKQFQAADLVGSTLHANVNATPVNLDPLRMIEFRFKLEIDRVKVDFSIRRDIESPFAGREERSPSTGRDDPDPGYYLIWNGRNTDDRRIVQRTDQSEVEAGYTQAEWTAARQQLSALAVLPDDCWASTPSLNDSLVINKAEYQPPVVDFRNWSHDGWEPGWGGAPRMFHQRRRGAVVCRDPSDIDAIVLHETASFGQLDRGWPGARSWLNGYGSTTGAHPDHPPDPERFTRCADVPGHGPAQHLARVAAHFAVHTDGSIAQHYDTVQRVGHGPPHNDHSIGIEFSNQVWARRDDLQPDGTFRIPDAQLAPNGTTWEVVTGWREHPPGNLIYIVPPREMLESLHKLVDDLIFYFAIPERWRALEVPGMPNMFLMNRGQADQSQTLPGIYAHFNFGTHTDGTFLTLYLWLRRQRNFCSFHAHQTAMSLCDAFPRGPADVPAGRWHIDGVRHFLNIDGIAHAPDMDCAADVL